MRILHFSDIHIGTRWRGVPLTKWMGKRAVGAANLLAGEIRFAAGDFDVAREYFQAAEKAGKREEFRERSGEALELSEDEVKTEAERFAEAQAAGLPYEPDDYGNPVRRSIAGHSARYPLERMREIERQRLEEQAEEEARRVAALRAPQYYLQAAIFGDAEAAAGLLTDMIDAGHDGTLIAEEKSGAVLYEIHLGPYADLEDAQRMSDVVRRSHGLSPAVIVVEPVAEE